MLTEEGREGIEQWGYLMRGAGETFEPPGPSGTLQESLAMDLGRVFSIEVDVQALSVRGSDSCPADFYDISSFDKTTGLGWSE